MDEYCLVYACRFVMIAKDSVFLLYILFLFLSNKSTQVLGHVRCCTLHNFLLLDL